MKRRRLTFMLLTASIILLFAIDMAVGASGISPEEVISALCGQSASPAVEKIILHIRLPKAIVALLAGIALSVSGLQMQTLFRNPLAGPYVLGISSGASLGVAMVIIGAPLFSFGGTIPALGTAGAAWLGSAAVLLLISAASRRIRDIMVILILGMMLSSGVGAVVQILQYLSREDALKAYVIWTMGSLSDVDWQQMAILAPSVAAGLIMAAASVKGLNMLLFGEDYARTAGLDTGRCRTLIFISTTLLAGSVTAFCGPIGFIGMAIPHMARLIFDDSDHRVLLPASAMTGAAVMLACDIISKALILPVNAICSLLGIPVVIWLVMRNKSLNV